MPTPTPSIGPDVLQPPQCPHGHAVLDPEARFCPICGTAMRSEQPASGCAVHPDVRAIGTCRRCGTFVCAACAKSSALGELRCQTCLEREQAEALPWDNRDQLGILSAFVKTCRAVLFEPRRTFSTAPPEAPVTSSLLFAALAQIPGILGTLVAYIGIFGAVGLVALSSEHARAPNAGLVAIGAVVIVIAILVMAVVMGTIGTVAFAGVSHLLLHMTGNTRSFSATLRGAALAQSTRVLGLIPFCGLYGVTIWAVILEVFAYQRFHGTSTGRATLAAVLAPAALAVLSVGLYALWFFAIASGMLHGVK